MCCHIRWTFSSCMYSFSCSDYNSLHLYCLYRSRELAPVHHAVNIMHMLWYTCDRQWKGKCGRSKLCFQETISGIEKHISYRSYRFGTFFIPNPSYVEQVDSGHMTHLCGWRDEATSPSHPAVCVGLCTCGVMCTFFEYNTAMLNPGQWIWLLLVNLKPMWPFCAPAVKPPTPKPS